MTRFVDLFAGVGGFRLGLEPDFECVWSCEVDRYARAVYRKHWEEPAGDIREIDAANIPAHEILCAGFPCQPFSIAGKRKGFQDIRGTLFAEIVRIAKERKPRMLFLENVKGLLSADSGRCFATILLLLAELGYSLEWEVLNSKNFGVPQNRERVFIVGHLREESRQEVFPIGKCNKDNNETTEKKSSQHFTATITTQGQRNCRGTFITRTRSNQPYSETNIIPSLRNGDKQEIRILHKDGKEKSRAVSSTLTGGAHSGGNHSHYDSNGIARTLKALGGGWGAKTGLYSIRTCGDKGKQKAYKSNDMGALTANPHSDMLPTVSDGNRIRRLTPIECERLQGFPDDWTKYGIDEKGRTIEISETQRYKMMGNAVTVNVIKAIAERLE